MEKLFTELYNIRMGEQFLCLFLFILELFISSILIFALKIADDIVLEKQEQFEISSREVISAIKEIREALVKINKICTFFKENKLKSIRKNIEQALDFINILMIFIPFGKNKLKLGKYMGLKIIKGFLLGLKIYNS